MNGNTEVVQKQVCYFGKALAMDKFVLLAMIALGLYLLGDFLLSVIRVALNTTRPMMSRDASLVKKTHEIIPGSGRKDACSAYYATFQLLDTHELVTLVVRDMWFARLDEGMEGKLLTRGEYFAGFEPEVVPVQELA